MKYLSKWILCLAILLGSSAQAKPLLYLPFQKGDSWYCVQGPSSNFSHQGKLQYSFDFNKGGGPVNSTNPAYGEWVYAPAHGEVVKVVEHIPDFKYNNANHGAANNNGYGNEIVIRVQTTDFEALPYYIRILHFKKHSVVVSVGDQVKIGEPLGRVGQSGFSTTPHLHIHVSLDQAGTQSEPFDFVEGPVKAGKWYKSDITPFASLLDNNNYSNLSNDFLWHGVTYNSQVWKSSKKGNKFTGTNYRATKQTGAKFKWKFKLATPGYFLIMARFEKHPQGDPETLYRVVGDQYLVDQTQDSESGWHSLGFKNLPMAGHTYQISVEGTTAGKRVSADAIEFIRIW